MACLHKPMSTQTIILLGGIIVPCFWLRVMSMSPGQLKPDPKFDLKAWTKLGPRSELFRVRLGLTFV